MTEIRILSDLHLEMSDFSVPQLPGDSDTVLILAGDIAPFKLERLLKHFLKKASAQFKAVVYVPGNHEYYMGTFPTDFHRFAGKYKDTNIHILDRGKVEIDGVVFLGATLWTDLNNNDPALVEQITSYMADYREISVPREGDEYFGPQPRLSPQDTLREHAHSRQWLQTQLSEIEEANALLIGNPKKTVVVMHHAPSHQSIAPIYQGNPFNGAFCSSLDALFFKHCPDLIVHGHTHSSFDYELAGRDGKSARVVANPRGYSRYANHSPENPDFSSLFGVWV